MHVCVIGCLCVREREREAERDSITLLLAKDINLLLSIQYAKWNNDYKELTEFLW